MIEFIGKFHPLFVHLPIGFFLLLGILEWLALRPGGRDLAIANRVIVLLTIPVSVLSAFCGWLLAAKGDYEANALFWHRWLGTAVALAAIALWIIRQRGWMTAYRRTLVATLILLTVASHFGGSLTHGSNFLSWPKARPVSAIVAPSSETEFTAKPLYATAIQPIFDKYCVSCHGAQKAKGGLRMDTAEALVKGGDSGPLLQPASASLSLLGKRLHLPLEDEDHMPPEGKPQLTAEQVAVISWWIESGAKADATPISAHQPTAETLKLIEDALKDLITNPTTN